MIHLPCRHGTAVAAVFSPLEGRMLDGWQVDRLPSLTLLAGLLLALWAVSRLWAWLFAPGPKRARPREALDTVLLRWNAVDVLTVRDLMAGGVAILGRPGSGKTSSSSFQLLRAVARLPDAGGLILSASPGDLELTRRAFGDQAERLVVFDESGRHRFNVLSFILACGGTTRDLIAAIYAIAETVSRGSGQGGGDDGSFFSAGARRIIECGLVVVQHATGDVTPSALLEFIHSAASSVAEVHSEEFKETVHYRWLKAAYERPKGESEAFDCELARVFFTQELPRMADRTRTGLMAVVMNILHVFNSGRNRMLFATGTTLTPAAMDEGRFLFIDTPIARCGEEGAFALGVWKFVTEWYALRRDSRRQNPPLVIHADEFHNTINAFDTRFLGECRKFSACLIACSQSKASFYANMGGEAAEAQVDAMLNNFSHKIVHALGDIRTAEWASQLCGSASRMNLGGSESPAGSLLDAWTGVGGWSGSFSEQIRPLVEPKAFMHGLRTGGAGNGYVADAYVIRSGEPFASGDNHLLVSFSQD